MRGYHLERAANENIFRFITAKLRATCSTIDRPGQNLREMVLTVLLIMPTGVCGETKEAGDVNSEYEGSGVSGMVECVRLSSLVLGELNSMGSAMNVSVSPMPMG